MKNYRKIYAMKAEREKRIENVCEGITNNSGIYVFKRTDENGIRYCYCGQAVKIKERCAAHLGEYDHIALSLKKRGFLCEGNAYGWELIFRECKVEHLDEYEKLTIRQYANAGYQLFNVTAGGQGKGKVKIGEYKPAKGYYDGILQGKKSLARELSHIIDKHLEIRLREEKKDNKVSQKALEKFKALLKEGEEDGTATDTE